MNVAMDTVAGERERRSLLPLLLNPVSRRSVVLGKWLAVSFFALAGLIVNVLGFLLGIGMFLVFSPAARQAWLGVVPLVGQQLQMEAMMNGRDVGLFNLIVLGCLTVALAIVVLLVAADRLQRDEIIYGN
jgi:ABC-type Na+ efflux pump permease subunit